MGTQDIYTNNSYSYPTNPQLHWTHITHAFWAFVHREVSSYLLVIPPDLPAEQH